MRSLNTIHHIALVPETDALNASELARVSAALQKQVLRDVAPIWNVSATVDAFPRLEDVPQGSWPIVISFRDLGEHAGVHLDRNGQPFAHLQASAAWSLDASRVCLDMLINPFENRTVRGNSPRPEQTAVEFLVEVTGACEDARHAYTIDDVLVSDFCTPDFFAARPVRAERYSFTDAISAPLQLLPGGHLTWYDPISDGWWLRSHRGINPVDTELGAINRNLVSLRELVQVCAPLQRSAAFGRDVVEVGSRRARHAAELRARRLRSLLDRKLDSELRATAESLQQKTQPEPSAFDDDVGLTLELADDEPPTAEVGTRRSTRPPLPKQPVQSHASATNARRVSTAPAATPLPWPVSERSQTLSVASVVRTMPSSSERRSVVRTGALVAGGAIAGAAVIALAFSARHPAQRVNTAGTFEAPLSAAVVPPVVPAVNAPAAIGAAPAPVPAPVPAAKVAAAVATPIAHPIAAHVQSVARPAPKAKPRDLPSPHTQPDPAIDDSLDALIGTRR